jgi:NTE family protein
MARLNPSSVCPAPFRPAFLITRGIDRVLREMFSRPGRTNDFRKLKCRLFLVATDLDSGESIAFGADGNDTVPISTAVQASAALPGLFPPVEINGRHYVDGALIKTLHASVALKEGADIVFCINPLVPFDAELAARRNDRAPVSNDGGLPVVLSQTFRAIIHSRMKIGMDRYKHQFSNADVLLFEPTRDDARCSSPTSSATATVAACANTPISARASISIVVATN